MVTGMGMIAFLVVALVALVVVCSYRAYSKHLETEENNRVLNSSAPTFIAEVEDCIAEDKLMGEDKDDATFFLKMLNHQLAIWSATSSLSHEERVTLDGYRQDANSLDEALKEAKTKAVEEEDEE